MLRAERRRLMGRCPILEGINGTQEMICAVKTTLHVMLAPLLVLSLAPPIELRAQSESVAVGLLRSDGILFPLARVQKIISGQEQPSSGHGSREMPVWGPIFSQVTRDVDLGRVTIDNLTRYLRDIQEMK